MTELGAEATGRRRGKPRGGKAAPKAGSGPKAGRGRRSGRADQAVALVEKPPGITAGEVAEAMKIKPKYIYRVLGDLEKGGRVKKDGRRYYPAS